MLCYWGAFPDKYFCNLRFWTLSNLCTRRKTHTFTLGILCDSWNLWGWHLWFSSGAKWIPRCGEMARIKVNKTEGQLSMDPGRKHVKFRRVQTVNWLVGTDIQVLEVTSVSKSARCWIRKKATHCLLRKTSTEETSTETKIEQAAEMFWKATASFSPPTMNSFSSLLSSFSRLCYSRTGILPENISWYGFFDNLLLPVLNNKVLFIYIQYVIDNF